MKAVEAIPISALPDRLGLTEEIERLKACIAEWIEGADQEMNEQLRWQLESTSKLFRPLTIFACHRAVNTGRVSERVIRSAAALELIHNVSLIIDDIVDRSRFRRAKLTLHCRFGMLPALMASGYITAGAFHLVETDSYSIRLLGELLQRLGVAECVQWRLRRTPLGVEDWREIAGEDTGSMFEICARLGSRDDRLRKFGRLLGIVYHGCDDVGDVRGAAALGGGGAEDIRDGILTLPTAIAIRDPRVALLFREPKQADLPLLARKAFEALPEAEKYLDSVVDEAARELAVNAAAPELCRELLRHMRALSGR